MGALFYYHVFLILLTRAGLIWKVIYKPPYSKMDVENEEDMSSEEERFVETDEILKPMPINSIPAVMTDEEVLRVAEQFDEQERI